MTVWLLGLTIGFLDHSLRREQLLCHEGTKAALWRETEASCHLRGWGRWGGCTILGVNFTAPGKTEHDCKLRRNWTRTPSQATPNSWCTELTNVYCFKLQRYGVICYAAVNNKCTSIFLCINFEHILWMFYHNREELAHSRLPHLQCLPPLFPSFW